MCQRGKWNQFGAYSQPALYFIHVGIISRPRKKKKLHVFYNVASSLLQYYDMAIKFNPDSVQAHTNIGAIYHLMVSIASSLLSFFFAWNNTQVVTNQGKARETSFFYQNLKKSHPILLVVSCC